MFHTVSPVQTRRQPTPPSVAFGQTPKSGPVPLIPPGSPEIGSLRDALRKHMAKYKYAIVGDLYANYHEKLPNGRARRQVNFLLDKQNHSGVTGADLTRFSNDHKLGLIEESSDMFFELYTLKAVNKGLITAKQVQHWASYLLDPTGKDESGDQFAIVREKIRREIETAAKQKHPQALEAFRKMVNRDWKANVNGQTPDRALDILALVGLKCALMSRKDSNYNIRWDNFKLLWGEGAELREEMNEHRHGSALKQAWVAVLSALYTLPVPLPESFFRNQVEGIVQDELGPTFRINHKDLMETVFSKQIGRQELDFSRPDIDHKIYSYPDVVENKHRMATSNKKRKCILKPYELLQEAAVLKNAQVDNPFKKPAEDVLHTQV